MRRLLLATAAAVAGALLAGGTVTADASPAGKRPRGKVAVIVDGKASCLPSAAVLPRPRGADPGLLLARAAVAGASNALGPRTAAALQRAIAKGFALLARLAQPKRALASTAVASDCGPPGVKKEESFTSSSGSGGSLSGIAQYGNGQARVGVGGEVSGGGRTFRFEYSKDLCASGGEIADCPTAEGVVDGTRKANERVRVEIFDGGQLVSSYFKDWKDVTTLRGQVAEDSKLDFLDIEHTVTLKESKTGAPALDATVTRRVRVNMRSGAYEPGTSSVVASGGGALQADTAARFAAVVAEAISSYRYHEGIWMKPNTCARLESRRRRRRLPSNRARADNSPAG